MFKLFNRESKAEKMNKIFGEIQKLIYETKQGNQEMREISKTAKEILDEMLKVTNQMLQANKDFNNNIVEMRKRG